MNDNKQLEAAQARPCTPQSALTHTPPSEIPPATKAEGTAHLASCLVLVAPSGMTAGEREEWLKAARMTLSGIPGDLLARGCEQARKTCRFASEIVPTILSTVETEWNRRKRLQAEREAVERNRNAPKLPAPDEVDPSEMAKLVADLRAKLAA